MSLAIELADPDCLYGAIGSTSSSNVRVRWLLGRLGEQLAVGTHELLQQQGMAEGRVLCAVILRGGAILYPGFAAVFRHADFCMVGMRRDEVTRLPRHQYHTEIPGNAYDVVLYIDCVAATGNTILEVRRLVAGRCRADREIVAVLSSSKTAADAIGQASLDLVGFSLCDGLDGDVVMPDLGERDAGDLFSGGDRC